MKCNIVYMVTEIISYHSQLTNRLSAFGSSAHFLSDSRHTMTVCCEACCSFISCTKAV